MKEESNCYGLASFSRVTSSHPTPLVGSSILHSNYIDLVISRAYKKRRYGKDDFYEDEQLMRLSISQSQFAEMITSMNCKGVPCTLRRVGNKAMDEHTGKSEREKLRDDFTEQVKLSNRATVDLLQTVQNLSAKLSKKDRAAIESAACAVRANINENMPFVRELFDESVDRSIKEAKGEIEAFITNRSLSNMVELNTNKALGEEK